MTTPVTDTATEIDLPCTPDIVIEDFVGLIQYTVGQPTASLTLDMISNGDCLYVLALQESETRQPFFSEVIKLKQPLFEQIADNVKQVKVKEHGSIEIQTTDLD